MRARPAISLACSMRKTASMVRCMSVAVTATDHSIIDPLGKGCKRMAEASAGCRFAV